MARVDEEQRRSKWLSRAVALLAGPIVIHWTAIHFGVVALFPLVGWIIVMVYLFDVPEILFSALDAARHKVAGVEHEGRHEWYGFRGTRMRVFLDEHGAPWVAVKELAQVLEIDDLKEAFHLYRRREFASPAFAGSERCLSDAGLRRFLKYSRHRDAHAVRLWWEREVLLPLNRRRELFSETSRKAGGRPGAEG